MLFTFAVPVLAFAGGRNDADPTVMNVGGREVKLSEFEYLYKKNNAQQASAISLDEYVGMFVNYKLKVRAAIDAGLDTAAEYRNDMARYASDLAAPYLIDKDMRDSLVVAAYAHQGEVLTVRHMLLRPAAPGNDERQMVLADSLREEIIAGADFEDIIRKYSSDPSAAMTGGVLNFTGGMLPYRFEDVAYNTAVGELSPVFRTGYGVHLLRVEGRRANPGEVLVRHILKRIENGDTVSAKAKIDSIYTLLKAGADFADVASRETDDPSGRNNGGQLPWFGVGRMIPEFEAAAYALADGDLSGPVLSSFGYHILLRENSRPIASLDSVRSKIEALIDMDYRRGLLERRASDRFGSTIGVKVNTKTTDKVAQILKKTRGLNEEAKGLIAKISSPAFTVGKERVSATEVVALIVVADSTDVETLVDRYNGCLENLLYSRLHDRNLSTLADRAPDYRNLLNEYSDGMLLYEISNREVWDRANSDTEGLQTFFLEHRDSYRWETPHYKGFVISAVSDSIAEEAFRYVDGLSIEESMLSTELRKKFGNSAKIDRVISGKGDNAIVDYVTFGGNLPSPVNRWTAWRGWKGKVIDQPESALDVKGAVSIDYQQQLEDRWLERLHATYPVKIYRERIAHLDAGSASVGQ